MRVALRVLPWQAEADADPRDVIPVIGGVGSGKSIWGADKAIEDACRWPKAHHFYIGSAKPSMRDGTTQTLLARIEEWGLRYEWSRSTLDVTLKSGPGKGATFVALSAETYQRWKGLLVDRAWCDEAQTWLDGGDLAGGMAYDFLLTRMRPSEAAQKHYPDLRPKIWITANPPHRTSHWLYQKFVANYPGRLYHPTVYENVLLPMPVEQYVDRLRESMSEDVFAIEVLGQWRDIGIGRVYTSFDVAAHRAEAGPWGPLDYDPDRELLLLHDFGVSPRVAVVAQVYTSALPVTGYQKQVLYVLDEIRIPDGSTMALIEEFVRRYPPERVSALHHYGDAAGETRNSTTGVSDWALIRTDPRMALYPRVEIRKKSANPPVVDRTNAVNAKLRNAKGEVGILIHPRCRYTIDDFQRTRWKEGTRQMDKGSPAKGLLLTHLSDAIGYGVEYLWPMAFSANRSLGYGHVAR